MASAMLPKSLQRTDSTGQLNVFILLKKKSNDDLIIISREDLPPTLRNGRLVLNQKIIIRDEERNSIEGVIIYMHSDRDNCLSFKKQLKENETQKMNASGGSVNSSNSYPPSRIGVSSKLPKNIPKKPSAPPLMPTQKPPKRPSTNKQLIEAQSKSSCTTEDDRENDDNNNNISSDVCNSPLSSITNLNEKDMNQTTFDTSIIITDKDGNDAFIDKINELSAKLIQQGQIIKDRDAQLKRLRSTMIEIPTEQVTQDYICYLADKIRQNTIGHKYVGSLTDDARLLGIRLVQLNECLNLKGGITTIARELFKQIVPEKKRSVQHWNELPEEVILKEKLLIQFLERYYGPLKVEQKKVHISLVGCLRNDRGKQRKTQRQSEILLNNDHLEEINDVTDEDNYQ